MKNFLKENWFKLGVLVALIIFALGPAYYFGSYLPNSDAIENRAITEQKMEQAENLSQCLSLANQTAQALWNLYCTMEGKENGCPTILATYADSLSAAKERGENKCYNQFPNN